MTNNQKHTKLYNVLFPFWMIMLFPQVWLVILPGNFIIDSLILIISMHLLKIEDKKTLYKKHILKIFGFGILSDIIGAAFMLLMTAGFQVGVMGDELYLTVPALIISSVLIYVFNYNITFKKVDAKLRCKLSIIFAVVTAPYTFLIPSSWLY
jgi:hypothetical protein